VSVENTITIIPLSQSALEALLISSETLSVIHENQKIGKKTLIFYNRRGTARAWMCADCGHFEKCPHCDIAFAYHTNPVKRLLCHQCNAIAPFPIECPNCHGAKIIGVGVGIERIAGDLSALLGSEYRVLRIDSDMRKKISDVMTDISSTDVILATNLASTLVHPDIGSVIFLSFELNLSIPEYDIEEQLFDEILFYKKQKLPIYLQTYTPEHPLIREILIGNQKTFFDGLRQERQQFIYPPFAEFVTIRVRHTYQKSVTAMMTHLVNKITTLRDDTIFTAADTDLWEKR
jgi:primosomal protein N' (replication factor Y) (superfamily II helicase)